MLLCCMLYAVRYMPYAVCCMLYAVCCMLYAVFYMLHAVCCMLYALYCMMHAVCCILYALFCMPYADAVCPMLYAPWCMLHVVCLMLYLGCMLYAVSSTMLLNVSYCNVSEDSEDQLHPLRRGKLCHFHFLLQIKAESINGNHARMLSKLIENRSKSDPEATWALGRAQEPSGTPFYPRPPSLLDRFWINFQRILA